MPITRRHFFMRLIRASKNGTFPGWEPGVGCRYLTVDGRKCGFGEFIPDKHEAQQYTSTVAREVLRLYPDLRDLLVGEVTPDDWQLCQNAHDTVAVANGTSRPWPHDQFVQRLRKCFWGDHTLITAAEADASDLSELEQALAKETDPDEVENIKKAIAEIWADKPATATPLEMT